VSRRARTLGLYTTEVYQQSRDDIIKRQAQELLELSTPVVQLWDKILVLPLIGTLDSERPNDDGELGCQLAWAASLARPVGRRLEPTFDVLADRLGVPPGAPGYGRNRQSLSVKGPKSSSVLRAGPSALPRSESLRTQWSATDETPGLAGLAPPGRAPSPVREFSMPTIAEDSPPDDNDARGGGSGAFDCQ
jgi:hypothetical protein